mgnify:CR=1 FL=1
MGLDIFSKKDDMLKRIDEHFAKVKVIHALPEYQDFLKYRDELEKWGEYVLTKRLERMQPLMTDLFGVGKYAHEFDEEKLMVFLGRVKAMEKRMSQNHHYSSPSNVMDLVWKYFVKYGVEIHDDDGVAYKLGFYTMSAHSGQGETCYVLTKPQRIY